MKPFPSITEFINYYNKKQTIPSNIAININDTPHEFIRKSRHNTETITKRMVDNYTYKENDTDGLGIELHINYYRYFEAKAIVEAYMLFFIEETLYLHPIYFHNRFVTDTDFEPYINSVSISLEKWTSLKWINTDIAPNAFAEARANAYSNIQKDLFYLLPTIINSDFRLELSVLSNTSRKKKWLLDDKGESKYFNKPFEVPEYW
ncbi:hypothetical protein [Lysinibacillus capsici]|uniref:hypothetical protein n=1 Tax=Lysinibacillus capsici TaxID=2115968 RepID=UPI003D75B9D1